MCSKEIAYKQTSNVTHIMNPVFKCFLRYVLKRGKNVIYDGNKIRCYLTVYFAEILNSLVSTFYFTICLHKRKLRE